MQVCVFLANGFETVEALAVVDICRRAELDTVMVSVTGDFVVESSHGIKVQADARFEDCQSECLEADVVFLPGGMPGTRNLQAHKGVEAVIKEFYKNGKWIAAICAAPSILGALGMLQGRIATSHKSVVWELTGAAFVDQPVVVDEHVITSRGMGTAVPLGLELVRRLVGEKEAAAIGSAIHWSAEVRA